MHLKGSQLTFWGEKGLGSLIYSYEHCERNPTFPRALEFRQSDYLKYLRILNAKLIYGSNNHKFAIIPVKRWGGLGFKALLLKGQELYSFYCVFGSLSHTAPTPGHHFFTHTLFMFIIISGFSDLFKVKPKGKIWRVHLKLKCLPKTANRSAICLEALK